MSRSNLLQHVEIFQGAANQAEARVYAQMPRQAESGYSLGGTIRGPTCRHAQTLQFDVPLVDRGPGSSILAEALMPDPCFWTTELPFLYEVTVELARGGRVIEQVHRTFGMRRLGVRGRSFYSEGERWVLRGSRQASVIGEPTLPRWRSAIAAMVVDSPTDELCGQASTEGVLLAAVFHASEDLRPQLRRVARHPAVAMAIISGGEGLPAELGADARNLILVQLMNQTDAGPAPWANAVMIDAKDVGSFAAQAKTVRLPIIASRRLSSPVELEAARRACDFLQRDLAPTGDFAGYVV